MKKILTLLALFLPLISFSQEQPQHEKIIFTDENGRIYVNKALPFYIKVSSSPSPNAEKHVLESKSSPDCSNPIYFAKEGLNYFYSPWAVDTITKQTIEPKQYIKFEVYADSKPPQTTVHNNTTAYSKGDTLYFGKGLKISFKTKDNVSGVSKTYYSIDGEAFKEYTTELTFDQEKSYKIKFYSVDKVGNVEEVQEIEFTIDSTKPLTNLNIMGYHIDNIISGTASISLKPQDAFSGAAQTFYILDNNQKQVYTQPIKASTLREGKHTLKYFTEDEVKNREDEKVFDFYVDKSPPLVIEEIIGDVFYANGKEYTSGRTQLQLTAIDNRAGVKEIYYSINGEEYQLYEKPFFLPNKQGTLKIDYYAVDKVENKTKSDGSNSMNNKFFQSYVDLNPPTLSHRFDGEQFTFNNTLYINDKTKIQLSAKDSESGMQKITYSFDKNTITDYESEITVNQAGEHSVTYYAYDNVNNSEQKTINFSVDNQGPEIKQFFSINPISNKEINGKKYDVYPKHLIVFLAAIDDMVGVSKILYSINDLQQTTYNSPIQNFQSDKIYELTIKAFDYLGNTSTQNLSFYIQ